MVVVEPDGRPFKGRSRLGPGFLVFLPLVPYGHQQISPDLYMLGSRSRRRSFPDEVGDTVVSDLRAEHVADRVLLREDLPPGERVPSTARYLHLTLTEGIFHRYCTAYGTSIAGAMLWFVGLPVAFGGVEIDLRAEIEDGGGRSLGSRTFESYAKATEFLYHPAPAAFSTKMQDAFAQISPELRRWVRQTLTADQPGGTSSP
jgi:hypothetical protein